MTANVGNLDRLARLVLGLVLIVAPFLLDLAIFANPLVKWGLPVVGLVFAGTALIRFCPLYAIFGIRTRSEN
ncbi:YgaP family membrane protein [Nisaea sediminum]|uniref:YgaP family membrane protein n=1 Tax=Nisaea sediminum TaxID=2775867 RepID=UPI001865D347|nr:DUF2892 domain-containing protein [Nisaea sediminum]